MLKWLGKRIRMAQHKDIVWALFFMAVGIFLWAVAMAVTIYRFDHPEKTETQLILDLIHGKIINLNIGRK